MLAVPNIPTAIESGVLPGYDVASWYGGFGHQRLSLAVTALNDIGTDETRFVAVGVVVHGSTAQEPPALRGNNLARSACNRKMAFEARWQWSSRRARQQNLATEQHPAGC
jgi:hypothetical protein